MKEIIRGPATVLAVLLAGCGRVPQSDAIAIEHVNVVEVDRGTIAPDRTVLIKGSTIAAVLAADARPTERPARTIDGRGKFLIPGLWDMHVHLWQTGPTALAVLLANGITGARDMAGDLTVLKEWRRAIESGQRAGPRLILSGPRLDGGPGKSVVDRLLIETPAQATRVVDSLAALHVDFLKIYAGLPGPAFFAAARRARALGLPLAGHVPESVPAVVASDSGMRSIEHIGVVPFACFLSFAPGSPKPTTGATDPCQAGTRDASLRRIAANGTWLDPTLVSYEGFIRNADSVPPPAARLRWVSDSLLVGWSRQKKGLPPWPLATWQSLRDFAIRLTAEARRAGVPVLVGTDLGNPQVYPGTSLHEELELLQAAGYSPAQALGAATADAARFLGLADSVGRVQPGLAADLVLLDADPLAAIRNTQRIAMVIRAGKVYDRAALDSLLEHSRAR